MILGEDDSKYFASSRRIKHDRKYESNKHLFLVYIGGLVFPLLMSCHTIFMLRNEITMFATEDVLGYFNVNVSLMLFQIELGAKVLVTLATRKSLFGPTFSN